MKSKHITLFSETLNELNRIAEKEGVSTTALIRGRLIKFVKWYKQKEEEQKKQENNGQLQEEALGAELIFKR